jgi:hypothetical protein
MQLGKALFGAIIGAALGIGLLVVVFLLFHLDAVWLAIPVAILTGLGVRALVSTSGHASYLRGALTGVLALAAYLGGWFVVAAIAQQRSASAPKPPVPAVSERPAEDTDETDEASGAVEPPPEQPIARAPRSGDAMRKAPAVRQFSTFDFIYLCVAALVAYELGRGSGAKPVETTEPAPEEMPQGTHPDA